MQASVKGTILYVTICLCVCVCVRACVRACVRSCVRACVRVRVSVSAGPMFVMSSYLSLAATVMHLLPATFRRRVDILFHLLSSGISATITLLTIGSSSLVITSAYLLVESPRAVFLWLFL